MDVVAHGLWAWAACMLAEPRWPLSRRTVAATVALAVLPDLVQAVPMAAWAPFGTGSLHALKDYVLAVPGQEPAMPPVVEWLSHHLHCLGHSAIAVGIVTALVWVAIRSLWIPLLGWWLHIVIDVFTHSSDFYPSPVLYPLTMRGFDGIAWNDSRFMLLNYTSLAVVFCLLLWRRRSEPSHQPP